jgi:hypothetical protein
MARIVHVLPKILRNRTTMVVLPAVPLILGLSFAYAVYTYADTSLFYFGSRELATALSAISVISGVAGAAYVYYSFTSMWRAKQLAMHATISVDTEYNKIFVHFVDEVEAIPCIATLYYGWNSRTNDSSWMVRCKGEKIRGRSFELPLTIAIPHRNGGIFSKNKARFPGIKVGNAVIGVFPRINAIKMVPERSTLTVQLEQGVVSANIQADKIQVNVNTEKRVTARIKIRTENWEETIAETKTTGTVKIWDGPISEDVFAIMSTVGAFSPRALLTRILEKTPTTPFIVGATAKIMLEVGDKRDETGAKFVTGQ